MKARTKALLALLAAGGVAAAGTAVMVRKLDGSGDGDGETGDDLTLDELRRIMPKLSDMKAREYLPHLNVALAEGDMFANVERLAMFLAQLGHESDGLTKWLEVGTGEAYEGRTILGNNVPGDGPRFKGRGPIQLTGRYNYATVGKALDIDLVNHPEDAALPSVGFLVAVEYWNSRRLSPLADAGDLVAVTNKINGGLNGLEQRRMYYERALTVLAHRRAVA
ncbi:hypothetical protein NR798_24130 [Archangium gephyra]|uniref:glycoside hydrolase family 19 protein n=1 Tax=Archangium gephyra TaxID=48 RepID=UPI0035D528D3